MQDDQGAPLTIHQSQSLWNLIVCIGNFKRILGKTQNSNTPLFIHQGLSLWNLTTKGHRWTLLPWWLQAWTQWRRAVSQDNKIENTSLNKCLVMSVVIFYQQEPCCIVRVIKICGLSYAHSNFAVSSDYWHPAWGVIKCFKHRGQVSRWYDINPTHCWTTSNVIIIHKLFSSIMCSCVKDTWIVSKHVGQSHKIKK